MKKLCLLLLLACILSSFSSPEELRVHNRQKIAHLERGMTKNTVITFIGQAGAQDFDKDGTYTINNPYRTEILKGKNQYFEVLYYHTDVEQRDRQLKSAEVTPLVFHDEKLIGWGRSFLKQLAQQYTIQFETEK